MVDTFAVRALATAFILFSQFSYQNKTCAFSGGSVHVTIFQWFPFHYRFRLTLWLNIFVSLCSISQIILHGTNPNKPMLAYYISNLA